MTQQHKNYDFLLLPTQKALSIKYMSEHHPNIECSAHNLTMFRNALINGGIQHMGAVLLMNSKDRKDTIGFGQKLLTLLENVMHENGFELEEFDYIRDNYKHPYQYGDDFFQEIEKLKNRQNADTNTLNAHLSGEHDTINFEITRSAIETHGIDISDFQKAVENPEAKKAVFNLLLGFAHAAKAEKQHNTAQHLLTRDHS